MAELQRQQLGGHVQGVRLVALDHRLRPLDGIRALAVLAVLATHAGIPFLPGGFVGVDVFFVLSGFLITSLLYDELMVTGRIDLGGFLAPPAPRPPPAARGLIVPGLASRPPVGPGSVAALSRGAGPGGRRDCYRGV